MPKNVSRFEKLWYTSLGIGILVSALEYQYMASLADTGLILFTQLIVIVFMVLFIWLVARRRKGWARWVLLIMFIIGLPLYFPQLSGMFERNIFAGLLSGFQVFLQIIGLYFIFTGDSAAWYHKERSTP